MNSQFRQKMLPGFSKIEKMHFHTIDRHIRERLKKQLKIVEDSMSNLRRRTAFYGKEADDVTNYKAHLYSIQMPPLEQQHQEILAKVSALNFPLLLDVTKHSYESVILPYSEKRLDAERFTEIIEEIQKLKEININLLENLINLVVDGQPISQEDLDIMNQLNIYPDEDFMHILFIADNLNKLFEFLRNSQYVLNYFEKLEQKREALAKIS